MTERQQRFVSEYLKDGNGSQAAIRAGFSKKGANVTASQLLAKPNIAQAVAEARAPALESAQCTLAGHLAMLATIRDEARAAGQHGAAASAEASRGKCAGHYTERIALTLAPGTGVMAVPVLSADAWAQHALSQQAMLALEAPVIDRLTAS